MTPSPTTPTPAIAEGEPPRLEACPWCKKPATFHRSQLPGDEYPWCAGCWSDGCTMDDLSTPYFQTCEEAAACWNAGARRPSPEGRREVLEDDWHAQWRAASARAEYAEIEVRRLTAALQATPARTGEGPTREEVERVCREYYEGHYEFNRQAYAACAEMGFGTDRRYIEAVRWLLAWQKVRGSLRTGEREAALEEAARLIDALVPMAYRADSAEAAVRECVAAIRTYAKTITTPPPATAIEYHAQGSPPRAVLDIVRAAYPSVVARAAHESAAALEAEREHVHEWLPMRAVLNASLCAWCLPGRRHWPTHGCYGCHTTVCEKHIGPAPAAKEP